MRTVEEVRRERLKALRAEVGSLVAMNETLGLDKRDSTLSQIINSAKNSKTGKGKEMGSPLARRIEQAFKKPAGWMDTAPENSYSFAAPVLELAAALDTLPEEMRRRALEMCWGVIGLATGRDAPTPPPTSTAELPESVRKTR